MDAEDVPSLERRISIGTTFVLEVPHINTLRGLGLDGDASLTSVAAVEENGIAATLARR